MKLEHNKLREKVEKALENIGDLIKKERKRKDIKIAKLSALAGVSSSVISDLENHKGVMPNIYTLVAIADALDLPDETFLNVIWGNVANKKTLDNVGKQERLKAVLSDYGLKANYMDKVISQVNYYISLENLDIDLKTINTIYETELSNGTKFNNISLDPVLIMEIKKNADRIEKAKADLL